MNYKELRLENSSDIWISRPKCSLLENPKGRNIFTGITLKGFQRSPITTEKLSIVLDQARLDRLGSD